MEWVWQSMRTGNNQFVKFFCLSTFIQILKHGNSFSLKSFLLEIIVTIFCFLLNSVFWTVQFSWHFDETNFSTLEKRIFQYPYILHDWLLEIMVWYLYMYTFAYKTVNENFYHLSLLIGLTPTPVIFILSRHFRYSRL